MPTANSSKKVVWVGDNPNNSSNIHNITKIVYSDNYRNKHVVWPCDAELTDVYLVRLVDQYIEDDEAILYTNDSNGQPNVTILPGEKYALKGTVNLYRTEGNQRVQYDTLTNCYFFSETSNIVNGGSGTDNKAPIYISSSTTYGDRIATNMENEPVRDDWEGYAVIWTDDTPGISWDVEVQAGYWDTYGGYIQLGFLFDPNYQSDLILRRATIYESIVLTSGVNSNDPITFNYSTIGPNQSVTVCPKLRRFGTATGGWRKSTYNKYTVASLDSSDIVYDSSKASVVRNSDGTYTITPLINEGEIEVDIADSELYLTVAPQHYYQAYDGSEFIKSSYTLTSPKTFIVKEADWDESINSYGEYHSYSGTVTTTSSNTSAVTISNNGRTVNPVTSNAGATSTITMSVGGTRIAQFTVTVGQLQTVVYSITNGVSDYPEVDTAFGPDHIGTLSSSSYSTEYTNCYDVTNGHTVYFGIKFGTDNSFNNLVDVYVDTDGEPCLYDENDREVNVMNDGDTIYFSFTRTSGQDLRVDIPIYADPNYENLLGTIKLTVYN